MDRFGDEAELSGDFGRKVTAFTAAIVARTETQDSEQARAYADALIATRQAHELLQAFSRDALSDRAPVQLICALAGDVARVDHEQTGWDATARRQIKFALLFAIARANDALLEPAQAASLDQANDCLQGLLAAQFPALREWTAANCACGPLELDPYMRRTAIEPWLRAADGGRDPRAVEDATRRLVTRLKRDFLSVLDSFSPEQRILIDLLAKSDAPVGLTGLMADIDVRRTGKPGALFSLALLGLEQRRAVINEEGRYSLRGGDFAKWYRIAANIPDARISKYVPRPPVEPARDVA